MPGLKSRLTLKLGLLLGLATVAGVTARAQWEVVTPAPTTADLRGIHNVGNGVAWASGTEGTVLRTINDGKDWQRCATPLDADHLDFRGIQAFDASTAIVMSSGKGPLSRLYKTADGCKTWKLLFTNPDSEGFWDDIRFDLREPKISSSNWRARLTGVLIGDPVSGKFVVFKTTNSGDTWKPWGSDKSETAAQCRKDESLFAASNSSAIAPGINGPFAFITGGKGGARLFLAEPHSPFDNGTTWKFRTFDLPMASSESAGAFSLAARTSNLFADLMAVGGDYKNSDAQGTAVFIPNRAPAHNLFSNPATASTHPPHGYRSAVAYDAASKTWITAGPNGTDISTDDGRNWRALRPNPALGEAIDADQHWNALSLPFVVGPHGRIGKLRSDALTPAKGGK